MEKINKTITINKNRYNFIQLRQEESKAKQMKRENKIKNVGSEIKSFQKSHGHELFYLNLWSVIGY